MADIIHESNKAKAPEFQFDSLLLSGSQLLEREKESQADAFLNGLAEGAVKEPLRAVKQLLGDSEALKSSHHTHTEASEGRKLGQIIGTLLPFAAMSMLTKAGSVRLFGINEKAGLARVAGEHAVSGFLLGSVFTPSDLRAGESLLKSRFEHGVNSALTFAAMGGSAHALEHRLPQFGKSSIAITGRRLTIAASSGATGGVVDAELRSGFKASGQELAYSALGFAAFGVLMESGGLLLRSKTAKPSNSTALEQAENSSRLAFENEGANKAVLEPELPVNNKATKLEELKLASEKISEKTAPEPPSISESTTLPKEADQIRLQKILDAVEQASQERRSEFLRSRTKTAESGLKPDSRVKLLAKEDLPLAREQLLNELKSFEGGGEAHRFKLYRELINKSWMSDAQKVRLTDVISHVRNFYAQQNTAENPLAFKAQRSWALSQASVAEAINEAVIEAKGNRKPDPAALEEKILLKLFSQFRIHENIPNTEITAQRLIADREAGARSILSSVGYPKEQTLAILQKLKSESVVAQPLDLVKYDAEGLKTFTPPERNTPLHRNPRLLSEEAIQEAWKYPSGPEKTLANGTVLSRWANESGKGELLHQRDGSLLVFDQANNRRFRYGKDGRITEASELDSRSFSYDSAGNLKRVESQKLGNLYRSSKGDWFRDLGTDKDGSPQINYFWDGKIVADDNGGLRLIARDQKQVRVLALDGSETWHPEVGRPEIKAADYSYEAALLQSRIEHAFTDPGRRQRLDGLLASFETEASSRGLDQNQKALFYRQLNRLLSDKTGQELPLTARANLAEQASNHAAFPTSIDQGSNSTCNVSTIENRIYSRSPQDMAYMLAELAEKGSYTTHSGAKIRMKDSLTGMKPDAEARESLRLQADAKNEVKVDGDRDWASQLVQTVMAKIKHLNTSYFIAKDTIVSESELVFDRNARLIGRAEKAKIEPLYDQNGKKLSSVSSSDPVFRKLGDLLKPVDAAEILYSRHGEAQGVLKPKAAVQELYDYFGKPLTELVPGSLYFDSKGKLVMYETLPGDITYDKLPQKPSSSIKPSEDTERLSARHLGKNIFLKEMENGKASLIDSPMLNSNYYRGIASEVSGPEKAPFAIARGSEYKTYTSQIRIGSESELAHELQKLKDDKNLPGILRVHTRNWPFNHRRGGWHVVNIQNFDPVKKTVEFTNQWGSQKDFVGEKAVSLEQMFKAMEEPKALPEPKASPAPKTTPEPKATPKAKASPEPPSAITEI